MGSRSCISKIAVIDGHYENEFFLTEACDLAVRDLRYDGITDVRILKMRYCEEISDEVLAIAYPGGYPGLALEHGAVLETSMMLYLFPHLEGCRGTQGVVRRRPRAARARGPGPDGRGPGARDCGPMGGGSGPLGDGRGPAAQGRGPAASGRFARV